MSNPYELAPEPAQPVAAEPTAFGPAAPVAAPATLGYAPPSLETPKANGGRAVVAMVFIIALLAMNVLYLPLSAWDHVQWTAAEQELLSLESASLLGNVALVWSGLYLLFCIGFLIAYMMWQYRAVRNVRIATGDSESGPGMSVGWWFIPIANLFKPYQVLKDFWERARVPGAVSLVGWFWAAWIIGGIIERVGSSMYNSASRDFDPGLAKSAILVESGGTLLTIASYALFAIIVRNIQRAQEPA